MRNLATLPMSDDRNPSILSPVFQRETHLKRVETTLYPQQQQRDRYAHLTHAQMQEVIRQQQMC